MTGRCKCRPGLPSRGRGGRLEDLNNSHRGNQVVVSRIAVAAGEPALEKKKKALLKS